MREPIRTTGAPDPIGPYSQAIAVEGLLFCCRPGAHRPDHRPARDGGIDRADRADAAQPRRHPRGRRARLSTTSSRRPASCADMDDFGAFNEVYATFFGARLRRARPSRRPACRSTSLVEIEAVAVRS